MPSKKRPPRHPYNSFLKERANELRRQSTPAEKHFWNNLRKMPFYGAITFNRQKPIGNYIADFYCHLLQLVIEIDGDSHGQSRTLKKDAERTEFLETQGLTVLRFTNREVEENVEAVLTKVEEFMEKQKGKSPPAPFGEGGVKT